MKEGHILGSEGGEIECKCVIFEGGAEVVFGILFEYLFAFLFEEL